MEDDVQGRPCPVAPCTWMVTVSLPLFVFDNLGIALGYALIGLFVLPKVSEFFRRLIPFVELSLRWTTLGGVLFFLTCGATHLEMVFHVLYEPHASNLHSMLSLHMLVIHTVQVVSVYLLLAGTVLEFGRPVRRAMQTGEPRQYKVKGTLG